MRVVVCVKQSVSGEINPFDACAYEAALRIPSAEVILLSMGPNKSYDFLKNLTRLGAKKGILLCDQSFAGADTLSTAYTLSLAVDRLKPDLIICGRQTMDGDTAQVGPELAVFAGYELISNAMSLTANESGVEAERRDFGKIYAKYPALVTVERINTLRLPSIRSKQSEVEIWNAALLNADISKCGSSGSPTKVIKTFENLQDRRKCKFIKSEDLKKVINESLNKKKTEPVEAGLVSKLNDVWVVTEAPIKMAKTVSDDIKIIPMDSAENLSRLIEKEKPNAVLWGCDSVSKETSARVAAILHLGLCADCTSLETDGENLFMYRPAFSGNIIAKIKSETKPVMATVRTTVNGSSSVTVGVGYGVKEQIERVKEFAKTLNADLVSSRLMVDRDYFPYSHQVGLTGKTVSPDVYIAVGISGAIHHIDGVRSSGTIIAVNPDKSAPIFDFADYGIVSKFEDLEI